MLPPDREKESTVFPFVMLGAGALVGALLGVLFAPDKGSETRRKVKDWMKQKAQKGTEDLELKREKVTAAIIAGRKAYEEVTDQRKEPAIK